MPDVMSYQQEMRSKGKGRRSFGGDGEVQANGSGRQKRVSEENEEGGDKKRRRVSAVSAKGKTPATEEEDDDEGVNVVKASGKAKVKKTVRLDAVESEDSDVQIVKRGDAKTKKGKEKAMDVDSRSVVLLFFEVSLRYDLVLDSPRKPGSIRLMTTQVTLSEDVIKVCPKFCFSSPPKL
jgi:hypothetical protein